MKRWTIVAAGLLMVCQSAAAQTPSSGLAAEGEGRWADAIRIYELAVEQHADADVLVRLADIYAHVGNSPAALGALERAARVAPANADIFYRLSQAYAAADRAPAAAAAAAHAVALAPSNEKYLRAAAVLETWAGDYSAAQADYRAIHRIAPDDSSVLLALARVSTWAGHTDAAVDAYRSYLSIKPDDQDAWLELSTAESWRGNYAGALGALDSYAARFGKTPAYLAHRAAALARGGRPGQALDELAPLLVQDPSNYDLNVTRTIALAMENRRGDALDALDQLRTLKASDPQTIGAGRILRTTTGSALQPATATVYSDSDHMRVARYAPDATLLFRSGTQLSGGYIRAELDAPRAGGLGRSDSGTAVYEQAWGGFGQRVGRVNAYGRIGNATADGAKMTTYRAGVDLRVSDSLTIGADHGRDFFVISPRTVQLGLARTQEQFTARWTPALTFEIAGGGVYQRISDGNVRWEATITPRKAVLRREHLNLDLGVSAYWLHTDKDLPSGYYQPLRYDNYSFVAFPYFKISENFGIGMSLAAGGQRERSEPFQAGGNASVDAVVGIYRAWALRISAAATNNRRVDSGAFSGYSGGIALVRRF